MPLRTCAKCGRPGQGRYCPEHQRQENARRTNKVTRYGYKSAHWQAVRKQRLELAGHVCELKLAGCTIRATHVHLPARYEGQHRAADVNDCRACCATCSGAIDGARSHSSWRPDGTEGLGARSRPGQIE
jgi:hypothetical protein